MAYTVTPKAFIGFAAAVAINPAYVPSANWGSGSQPGIPNPFRLRASSVGLQLKQEITTPPLIDGIVNLSAYQLGAKMVEGDIAFPLIHEGSALTADPNKSSGCGITYSGSLAGSLWQIAAQRDANGRLGYYAGVNVAYPDNSVYNYPNCLVNTMKWTVNQGAAVEVSCSFVGGGLGTTRDQIGSSAYTTDNAATTPTGTLFANSVSLVPNYLSPARIVTWNDFTMAIWGRSSPGFTGSVSGSPVVADGAGIRSFDVELKNNVERYMTLNGLLAPQDITAKKQELSGTFKILGRSQWLNYIGESNDQRYTSDETMAFGYKIGSSGNIYWSTALHGLIFNIEEMSINPSEVFETSVVFRAMGDCSFDYSAADIGTSGIGTALTQPAASNYGIGDATDRTLPPVGFSGWF